MFDKQMFFEHGWKISKADGDEVRLDGHHDGDVAFTLAGGHSFLDSELNQCVPKGRPKSG